MVFLPNSILVGVFIEQRGLEGESRNGGGVYNLSVYNLEAYTLGMYTLGVYSLGPRILDLEPYTLGSTFWGSTLWGSRGSATDFGSVQAHARP